MKVENEVRDLKRKIGILVTKHIRFLEEIREKIDEKVRRIKCIE